jgi:hypothetical protein
MIRKVSRMAIAMQMHSQTGGESGDILESNDIVTGLDGGHTLADRLDDTGTLVTQDDRERTLGVLAGQSVGI